MTEYMKMTGFELEHFKIRQQLQELSRKAGEAENEWNGDQIHFFLSYDFEAGKIFADFAWDECHGDVYFPTRESAREAIAIIGVERLIKYWFGIPHILVVTGNGGQYERE